MTETKRTGKQQRQQRQGSSPGPTKSYRKQNRDRSMGKASWILLWKKLWEWSNWREKKLVWWWATRRRDIHLGWMSSDWGRRRCPFSRVKFHQLSLLLCDFGFPFFNGRSLGCETWEARFSSHVWVETSTSKGLVVSGRWWRSWAMSLTPPPMPLARAPGRVQPPHSLSQALHRAPCSLQPRGMLKGDFASSSQENIHHVFLLSSFYCPEHSSFMGEPSGVSHFRWLLLTHSILLDSPASPAQAQKTKGGWILLVLFSPCQTRVDMGLEKDCHGNLEWFSL